MTRHTSTGAPQGFSLFLRHMQSILAIVADLARIALVISGGDTTCEISSALLGTIGTEGSISPDSSRDTLSSIFLMSHS